ncbi:MAG: ATP synthase F1 subunit delta [Pseudomonadota bacterium]
MISQTVARRYAQALLAIGREDGKYEQYGQETASFAQLMSEPGVSDALTKPIYPAEIRRKILDQILLRAKFSPIIKNFLGLLQDKGRTNQIQAINAYYQRLVDELNNVKRAMVTASGPLSKAIQKEIKVTLEKLTGKTIILEMKQDPEIIGGIVAKVGDLTLDGSIKTQLKNLKESLIKG